MVLMPSLKTRAPFPHRKFLLLLLVGLMFYIFHQSSMPARAEGGHFTSTRAEQANSKRIGIPRLR